MASPLQLQVIAPWRQRFRGKGLASACVAPENPARGILQASWDGQQLQIYAWEIPSGDLRPLLWDPRTDQRRDLLPSAANEAVLPIDWSADGTRLLLQTTHARSAGLFVYDLAGDELPPLNCPPRTFRGRSGPFHTGTAATFFGPDGTVWALSQKPDLWAGAVAPVAIVDWTMNYEDSSAAMRGWARMIFDGSPQQKANLYRERSPLTHAAAIQTPLLIFQGRHDSCATPCQMEVFARRMQEMDKDFTLIWLDAGHGAGSSATAERIHEAHMKFAYRLLGLSEPDVD